MFVSKGETLKYMYGRMTGWMERDVDNIKQLFIILLMFDHISPHTSHNSLHYVLTKRRKIIDVVFSWSWGDL